MSEIPQWDSKKVAQRDEQEWRDLYGRTYRTAIEIAKAMGVPAADREDVVQDAYLGLLSKGSLPENVIDGYLFKAVRNRSINQYRKRERQALIEKTVPIIAQSTEGADELRNLPPSRAISPEDHVVMSEASQALVDQLQAVPEPFFTTTLFRLALEMPYDEIAESEHIPPGTVMSRIHRGRQILKEAVEPVRELVGASTSG